MATSEGEDWPEELRLKRGRRVLEVAFADGRRVPLSAEFLRVLTPSAERKGHAASDEKILAGKREVAIARIEPVGRYAVRLVFDDGHATGIYTHDGLARMAARRDALWRRYEEGLAATGLSRDAPGTAPWPGGSGLRG